MVEVRVRGWVIHYAFESTHKQVQIWVCVWVRVCVRTVERCRRPLRRLTLRSLVAAVAPTSALSFIRSVLCIFPLGILRVLWPSPYCWEPRLKHILIVNYMVEKAPLSRCLSGCSSASSLRPFFAQNEWRQCFYPFHSFSFCSTETILSLIVTLSTLYLKLFRKK